MDNNETVLNSHLQGFWYTTLFLSTNGLTLFVNSQAKLSEIILDSFLIDGIAVRADFIEF